MLTILIASSKGGCGKTTLATNLAAAYAQNGARVVIADADRQRSSTRWCIKRPSHLPGVLPVDATRKRWRGDVPGDADVLLLDAPAGTRAKDLDDVLGAAHAVLVPVMPSQIDLEATEDFLVDLKEVARVRKGKLAVGLVANRLRPWTNSSQTAVDAMREFGLPVVAEIRDSQGYVFLTGLGKSIFDYKSEEVRKHQADWVPMIKWLKQNA
ncbi:MAG: ParA family protein [Lysobacterales bacterium]